MVGYTWKSLREASPKLPWYGLVWFPELYLDIVSSCGLQSSIDYQPKIGYIHDWPRFTNPRSSPAAERKESKNMDEEDRPRSICLWDMERKESRPKELALQHILCLIKYLIKAKWKNDPNIETYVTNWSDNLDLHGHYFKCFVWYLTAGREL